MNNQISLKGFLIIFFSAITLLSLAVASCNGRQTLPNKQRQELVETLKKIERGQPLTAREARQVEALLTTDEK
jgi:hypothetical protein